MINPDIIEKIITPQIEEDDYFIVSIKVSTDNKIAVEIDSDNGISISDIVRYSKLIEGAFDRDEEDFSLDVATPGLGRAIKIKRQYKKYVGQNLEVLTTEGVDLFGELTSANDNEIIIKSIKKEKVEGSKKKELVETNHIIAYSDIKKAKVKVSL